MTLSSLFQSISRHGDSYKRVLIDTDTRKQLQRSLQHIDSNHSYLKICQHFQSMARVNELNNFCLSSSHSALEDFIASKVWVDNPKYWQQAHQFDGPVIFVTPHYGPFAMGCLKAVLDMGNDKTVNAFYDPPEKNPTTAIYKDVLSSLGDGFNPIFNDSRGLVRAIKCLKKKQILTMMPDVFDLSGQSISIPFFGHFTTAMAGTAFLALKTNALIMQAYCVPDNHGGVKCILHKPFQFPKSNDADQDVYNLTSRLFKSIEQQLRLAPEHWIYLRQLDGRLGLPLPEHINFPNSKHKIMALAKNLQLDYSSIESALKSTMRGIDLN